MTQLCFVDSNIYPLVAGRSDISTVGGAEVQQYLIGCELARHEVKVSYVTEDYGQGPAAIYGAHHVWSYRYDRNKLRQAVTLWQALAHANADLYYVRGAPNYLLLLLAFVTLKRRKLILAMSTNQLVYPRPYIGMSRPLHWIYRLALRKAAAVIAQTEFQRQKLAEHYQITHARVIRNGALPSSAVRSGPSEGHRPVVWLASIYPYKGPEQVFELARLLPDQRFIMAGGPWRGMAHYFEEIKHQAEGFANIEWRGPTSRDQIDPLLADALALINTTVTHQGIPNLEGFPNVYLEAWRNGVPTLTLSNDPDEIITRHGLGWRCDTVEQMAVNLQHLAQDPALRLRMGEAALAYFTREHDIHKLTKCYLQLVTELSNERV